MWLSPVWNRCKDPSPPVYRPLMHKPGQHFILLGTEADAAQGRAAGLILRDCVTILLPGPQVVHAFIFRAPLEGTVADTVLRHGAGGMDVNGCRVYSAPGDRKDRLPGGDAPKWGTNTYASDAYSLAARGDSPANPAGRWPPNLLLVHGEGCKRVGERSILARGHIPRTGNTVTCFGPNGHAGGPVNNGAYADPDGHETVAAWECQDGCPVKALDEQSGERRFHGGGAFIRRSSKNSNYSPLAFGAESRPAGQRMVEHDDSGTASRFFPQFTSLPEALAWLERLVAGPSSA